MNLRILTSVILLFLFSTGADAVMGQTSTPNKELSEKQTNKRVNIYYHLGSIELPEGYKAYRRESFTDAWYGSIESADGKFKINWAAGTVESLFVKYEKDFKWIKSETSPQNKIKLGLMRDKKNDRIVVGIEEKEIEFTAVINDEKEQDLFMEIIRSYQKERCENCRTALFKSTQK